MEIKNRKKRIRELLASEKPWLDKKIAILCGSSLGDLPELIEIFLLENEIRPTFFIGNYNRYYDEGVFGQDLQDFHPDIVYFHTTHHNIENLPVMKDSPADVLNKLENETMRWRQLWGACRERFSCVVIQNNFDEPAYRVMGNLESVDPRGYLHFIHALNSNMAKYANGNPYFYIQDIHYLSAQQGLFKWHDIKYMHLYKYAVSAECMPVLAKNFAGMVSSLYGRRKKCIVLDLDNTLWGGLIGEVGAEGLLIGMDTPVGESFAVFQKQLKRYSDSGIILCVASKNEDKVARSGFDAAGMVLKLEDIVLFYVNWEPKTESIRKIAETLNIGLDSMVFIDDNPAERELVRSMLPQVAVIEGSAPDQFMEAMDQSGFFETMTVSTEDLNRTALYSQIQKSSLENVGFEDYNKYLKSLSMACYFWQINEKNIARVTQLIGKTNQFNLTTWRLSEAEVTSICRDPAWIALCGRLVDKFGDQGIITVLMGFFEGDCLDIKVWILSCRVFSRHVEFALFDEVVKICREREIARITGTYKPTAKNRTVYNLYRSLGFHMTSETEDGITTWEFKVLPDYENKNRVIESRYDA